MLGEKQKLHSLAIEDLVHTSNRTKADWYPEHVFGLLLILPICTRIYLIIDSPADPAAIDPQFMENY